MADDFSRLPNDKHDPRSMALLPSEAGVPSNGELTGGGSGQNNNAMADPMVYVHALRRRWFMIFGIGLLIAVPACVTVWLLMETRYTATAYLRIAMLEDVLLSGTRTTMDDPSRFEIFKNTQRQMIVSRFVLSSAIQKPEVARIPDIKRELREGDAVKWLADSLGVGFPGGAEVMSISLSLDNAVDAQALVGAVVDSYMNEYVNAESDRKRKRLNELDDVCAEKDQYIRKKREQLKSLGQDSGSMNTVILNSRQRIMLEELSLASRQLSNAQFETKRFRGELAAQKALLANADNTSVPALDLDMLIQRDPVARQLSMELGWKSLDVVYQQGRVKETAKNQYGTRLNREVENLQIQYDARVEELTQKARDKQRSEIGNDILRLETRLSTTLEQQESLEKEIDSMRAEAVQFGIVSVEIQMLIADLKQQEQLASQLAGERDKLEVELNATPRISRIGTVEKPRIPSNTMLRYVCSIFALLGGFALPAVAIAFIDAKSGRINSSNDVSQKLQVPVIGSVPRIPAHVIHRMSSPSKRHRSWHLRLTESVDGIAARLLRNPDKNRVIMVSSAVGGEGKTTLATQLALSLARTGRSTVLVDFDLRRPSFDEVFGVSLTPGVSELLRGQNGISDLLHETNAENLSVVAAGQWDRKALAALSNSKADDFFKELKERFDFVVVDTSPILPVADARFVSQAVDMVVLSVFRDVSQAPKIQAACEILTAFGVQSVEAVVTGLNEHSYGKHMGYESTVNA